ncbi:MAG: sulfatase-like hydrolase/transferase [Candidatus Binatia bacterium]
MALPLPNVLFLLVDCLRGDAVGRRGHRPRVPWLSRLAREGLHCTQMISAATTTTPCVASILTGHYSPRHGIRSLRGFRLRPGLATLPGTLAAAGYHTRAEVTGPLLASVGLERDFHTYRYREQDAYLDGPWGADLARLLAPGGMPEPWFLFVHLWELHVPRRVRPGFEHRRYGRNPYEQALSALDARLEPLLAPLAGRAMIAVHGDHGEQLPVPRLVRRFYRWQRNRLGRAYPPWPSFPLREGHGFDVWEPLVRVPFVAHLPGRVPAQRVERLTRQIDVMPTLLDVLGLPLADGVEGRSVLDAAPTPLDAYVEACGESIVDPRDWRRGIRTDHWKYIQVVGGGQPEQLYDVRRDPRERRNLATARPDVVAALRSRLAVRLAAAAAEDDGSTRLSADEDALVEAKLRDLGYIE